MPARERTRSNGRTRDHGVVPILDARPGGVAQRFAASMRAGIRLRCSSPLCSRLLDVGAGALIGIGAVVVLLFACRAAGVAAPARAPARRRPVPLAQSHPVVKLNKRDPQER